jgi:hypothetical protein
MEQPCTGPELSTARHGQQRQGGCCQRAPPAGGEVDVHVITDFSMVPGETMWCQYSRAHSRWEGNGSLVMRACFPARGGYSMLSCPQFYFAL